MFGQFKVKVDGELKEIIFEKHDNLESLDKETRGHLSGVIHSILVDCWGKFHDEFIDAHVMSGNRMIMAKIGGEYVGFGVLSFKKISGRDIHYVEFLAIKRKFQKTKLGPRIFYLIILDDIIRNFFSLFYKPIEIMFITPNIRALVRMTKFASFIYPNPYSARDDGSVPSADETTWLMAQELIRGSDKPNRPLDREGLVLRGSYTDTPWLIYGPDNAPWIDDLKILSFIKRYMGYHNGEDRELVVRAHITLNSIMKYFYNNISR